MVGQIFIKYPFVAYFNSNYIKTLKKSYPLLSNVELNKKLITMMNKAIYQQKLNDYLSSKAVLITLITFIIFGFIFYKIYSKYKEKGKQIPISNLIILGVFISLFYNILIFNINNVIHITDNYVLSDVGIIVLILTTGIMGPILEELLFRGIVFNRLRKVTSKNKSIVIASLLFAIFHLPNVVNCIYAYLLSFVLIKVYEKYKTIKAPILIHCACNITTNLYLYFLLKNIFILNYGFMIISMFGIIYIINKLSQ